ncbi:hypothetical protein Ddc_13628 [Ditylenchus destructor]|nr:hypothetical protein Ddc_13628 [Ditylenchus destructor]
MTSTKTCCWLLIFATFLRCCQLIPIPKKDTENLKSDLGIAKDSSLTEFLTEKRSPQPNIPENIQLLSNDERSSVINPHTPPQDNAPDHGSAIKETAAEQNFRSTKKSGQTPPQDNAPDHGSRKKRKSFTLTMFSPHLFPMAEFFPNNGGILHPINYRG